MGIAVMILGESGSGKSRSFKNLDPKKVMLFKATNKPLPFRSNDWNNTETTANTHDWKRIINGIKKAPEIGKEIIIIDDFQYVMSEELMSRFSETGYTKFTELAVHVREVIRAAQDSPENIRIYITWHSETDEKGFLRPKTIGKMLSEKICVEGLFTIVLKSFRKDQLYFFQTQTSGFDVCKSPEEMFENEEIPNDLNEVDKSICEYYEIN